jgi:hypothetical protein
MQGAVKFNKNPMMENHYRKGWSKFKEGGKLEKFGQIIT